VSGLEDLRIPIYITVYSYGSPYISTTKVRLQVNQSLQNRRTQTEVVFGWGCNHSNSMLDRFLLAYDPYSELVLYI